MKKLIEKLDTEQNDLAEKSIKLKAFINSNPEYKQLSPTHQWLLVLQGQAMDLYYNILDARVDLLDEEDNVKSEK